MRKSYIITIFCLIINAMAFSQVPHTIGYQAVVRSGSGELVRERQITLRLNILQGDVHGESVYEELHRPTSNENGLVDIEIGAGETTGDFSAIDWSATPYYIKVEIDPLGGDNYSIEDVNQILAVPYAIYAAKAGSVLGEIAEVPSLDSVLAAGNDAGGRQIKGLANPMEPSDAATKNYVDSMLFNVVGAFVDGRDGNAYKMVTLCSQTWMAENLRYEGNIPYGTANSSTRAYRGYPNGEESNVPLYGYIYNWTAVMNGESGSAFNPSGVQGICPDGWHLPSIAEWRQLVACVGDMSASKLSGRADLWLDDGILEQTSQFGTSGFNVLPSGTTPEHNSDLGYQTDFWSSTFYSTTAIWYSGIYSNVTEVDFDDRQKSDFGVVRCVRNSSVGGAVLPSVNSMPAEDVTAESAALHGVVTDNGGAEISDCGFVYGTNEDELTETLQANTGSADFAYTITDLVPSTTYYYKAYAVNVAGTNFGDVLSFSTEVGDSLPTVETLLAKGIYSDSATMCARIKNYGQVPVTGRGFVYWTEDNSFTDSVTVDATTNDFSYRLADLIPETEYYYRAFIYYGDNSDYLSGDTMSFRTNGLFTDERDGNVYETVTIGEQTWMAQNLRYGDEDCLNNCIYSWTTAMNGELSSATNPSGVQGLCPNGWHLPSNSEWSQLSSALGDRYVCAQLSSINISTYSSYIISLVPMFATSGFNAFPNLSNFYNAYFWTTDESVGNRAYYRHIYYLSGNSINDLETGDSYRDNEYFVRCVRNN